jgi:hypothetical protein
VGKRRRGGAATIRDGEVGEPPERDRPASPAERWVRLALVVARNAVGFVGILFYGWSAPTLLVLYFADTLAGMWAVFAAVGFKLGNPDPRQGVWSVAEGAVSAVLVALLLAAFVAVPLGIPLVMLLGASGVAWRQVWADSSLRAGIGVVALTALVGAARNVLALAQGRTGDALVKQAFAILMTRWVLVLIVIYGLVGLLGRFALYVVVVAYAAASAWSDLEPERFARLIPDRRPAGAR